MTTMNLELSGLFDDDRADHRRGLDAGTPEYLAMRDRDRLRRARAAELIANGAVRSGEDHYHAAMLFQHGDSPEDAWRAHTLALRAAELGHQPARWLTAAAYDRWLMYRGQPQKYGTQYVADGQRHRLWDVEPTTTDEDRAQWDVPPLAEQLRKAEEATRRSPPPPLPPREQLPEWLRTGLDRWGV